MGVFIDNYTPNQYINSIEDILIEGFVGDKFQKFITFLKDLLTKIKKWFLDMINKIKGNKKDNKDKVNKEEFNKNIHLLTGTGFEYETYKWDPKTGLETVMDIIKDLEHAREMTKDKFEKAISSKDYEVSFTDVEDYLYNQKIESTGDIIKLLNTAYGKIEKYKVTPTNIQTISKVLEYIDETDYVEIMTNIGTKSLNKIETDLNNFIAEINKLKSEYGQNSESEESKKSMKLISDYYKYYTLILNNKRSLLQTSFSLYTETRNACDNIIRKVNISSNQTKKED